MISKRILDSTLAYLVRYTPSFLGRHRHRYRFYQRIKNSDLRLHGRLKHSRVKLALNLGDWIQYWLFMDGAYERDLVGFLYPRVKDKVLFDVGANVGKLHSNPRWKCTPSLQLRGIFFECNNSTRIYQAIGPG